MTQDMISMSVVPFIAQLYVCSVLLTWYSCACYLLYTLWM